MEFLRINTDGRLYRLLGGWLFYAQNAGVRISQMVSRKNKACILQKVWYSICDKERFKRHRYGGLDALFSRFRGCRQAVLVFYLR